MEKPIHLEGRHSQHSLFGFISSFGLDIRVAVRAYRIDYEHEQEHEHDEIGDYLCESVLIRG
ncbi:MAG: hypothetical protein ACJ8KF_16180 [Chthoniobacterales bacterium]